VGGEDNVPQLEIDELFNILNLPKQLFLKKEEVDTENKLNYQSEYTLNLTEDTTILSSTILPIPKVELETQNTESKNYFIKVDSKILFEEEEDKNLLILKSINDYAHYSTYHFISMAMHFSPLKTVRIHFNSQLLKNLPWKACLQNKLTKVDFRTRVNDNFFETILYDNVKNVNLVSTKLTSLYVLWGEVSDVTLSLISKSFPNLRSLEIIICNSYFGRVRRYNSPTENTLITDNGINKTILLSFFFLD
ncbi:hypothetical protein HK099_003060, partial [Clydaea vesicula]